jgi:hypothetical protein
MRRSRLASHLVGAATVLASAIVVSAFPASAGDKDARALLTKVQSFVNDATSVDYEGEIETEYADPNSAGSRSVDRGTFEEAAVFPERGRSLVELSGYFTETIYVGSDVYLRDGDSRAQLEKRKFEKLDASDLGVPGGAAPAFPLFQRPQDLAAALRAARRPEIVGAAGNHTVLEVRFPPAQLVPPGLDLFDVAAGRLVTTSEGQPKRLVVKARGPDSRLHISYEFSRWNGPVSIDVPSASDVDLTPFLDEEAIDAYDDAELYQPAAIPEGWVVDLAWIVAADESTEGCKQVEIDYVDPVDPTEGFMELYLFPTECGIDPPRDSEEFVAGPYRGFIYEEGVESRTAEFDVSGTRVQVVSDLSAQQLARILADLIPLDLANPPPATISLAEAV